MNRFLAEFLGTFFLVFAGCGAITVNSLSDGAVSHVGICMVFGFIVTGCIYSFGNISGAHINPAVTVGFVVARKFPVKDAACYVISQLLGGIVGGLLLGVIFPEAVSYGHTIPGDSFSITQAFLMETVLTFVLMSVILNVSTGHMEKGIMAGVSIGGVVAMSALYGGPVCGASMNPARSLGPAVVSGEFTFLWIYFVAPVVGAVMAYPTCKFIQNSECCHSKG